MNIDQNKLRAWAGLILLILAVLSTILKYENTTLQYTIIALVSFLVGGALLQKTGENK
jgi:uncharacterized membrane protein